LPRPLTPPGLSRPLLRKFHWQLLWLYHDAARLEDAPLAAELAQLEAMQRRISIALGTHRASDDKE
jgi:hypothetical protein